MSLGNEVILLALSPPVASPSLVAGGPGVGGLPSVVGAFALGPGWQPLPLWGASPGPTHPVSGRSVGGFLALAVQDEIPSPHRFRRIR